MAHTCHPLESRETGDPLGRAMLEYHRGDLGTLRYRDGATTADGNVEEYYFSPPETWDERTVSELEFLATREPVVDVGCGAGQHVLWLQERGVDVVGVDASPSAVQTARERGASDVQVADMFALPFDRDRFGGLLCIGTQLGLGGSLEGIAALLADFARVTTNDGVALVDNYDPSRLESTDLGYRPDPRDGIAHRCFHFEYESDRRDGTRVREIGPTLHFLLCSPDRLREATIGTPWTMTACRRTEPESAYYRARLEKR